MQYFKSVVKNVYQKVIEDEYLQQLTEQQVYFIINNTSRKRLASHGKDPRKMSSMQIELEIFQKVDQLSTVTPERIFRLLGPDPSLEVVRAKLKEVNENLDEVTALMQDNFPKYDHKIASAIQILDNTKNVYTTKKHALQLRGKIQRLQQATTKSKNIMHLHIKAKNIKKLIKVISEMPNIKKMTLTQLKSINIEGLKNKSIIGSLTCLSGINGFIEKAVASQLTQVLQILQKCLINKFQQHLYQNALKDFIIAQHETIKYQKLVIKLVQNHIRKIESELHSNLPEICQFYIRVMINLHGVFRWHRLNQKQQKWENLSKGHFGISIEIDINNVTKKVTANMDECFKELVLQKFYHLQTEDIGQHLEILYLVCRISQIGYTFSGQYFSQSLKQSTQFLYKKLQKQKQKASHQLEQTLKFEQKNNWNRLPVIDSYSHEPVDKTLFQIHRHLNSEAYDRVMEVLAQSKAMFRDVRIEVGAMGVLGGLKEVREGNLWDSVWEERVGNGVGIYKKESSSSKYSNNSSSQTKQNSQHPDQAQTNQSVQQAQQVQQTWQIQPSQFPPNPKYQKYKTLTSLKPLNPSTHKTIICQYSLTILKYTQLFIKYAFYYPVEPVLSFCLSCVSLILEFYAYNIFTGFISNNLKLMFFQHTDNLNTLQQKYHKKRLHHTYPTVSKFITEFKQTNKLTMRQQPTQQDPPPQNIKHANSYTYTNLTSMIMSSPGGNSSNHSSNNAANNKMSSSMGLPDAGRDNVLVRSRVVALESFKYLVMYYEHIMTTCGFYFDNNHNTTTNGNSNTIDIGIKPIMQQLPRSPTTLIKVHPDINKKITQKLNLYKNLYQQLSQFVYTDCIPKFCKLADTQMFISNIKWNDTQQNINEYMLVFSQQCKEFYYKMNSNNRGEVPVSICDRLFGVYWKTQLSMIMKTFLTQYKYQTNMQNSPKSKLQKFIDGLYENISPIVKQKIYMRVPYQKIKAVFPILMQSSWQTAFQLIKISLNKYQFIFAVEMGLILKSESCCYLGYDLQDRKKLIQNWIQEELIRQKTTTIFSTPKK